MEFFILYIIDKSKTICYDELHSYFMFVVLYLKGDTSWLVLHQAQSLIYLMEEGSL